MLEKHNWIGDKFQIKSMEETQKCVIIDIEDCWQIRKTYGQMHKIIS